MNDLNRPNTNPSVVDPGILEMGASVSVNDELRRNLTAEMANIDSSCTKLVSDVTREEDRAKDMQKSKHYVGKEQSNLLQCTSEMVETSQMNSHIFHGLQSKVENEVICTSSPQDKSSASASDGNNIVTPSDGKSRSPTSVFAIQQINYENEETIMAIGMELGDNANAINKFKVESNEMKAAADMIYVKMKSEHLKVVLANAKHKVQLVEDLLKDKQMHHRTNKVNCDTIDEQNKALQDKSIALETELTAKKNATVELEDTFRKVEAKSEEKNRDLTKKCDDLKKEVTRSDDKVIQLSTSTCDACKNIKKRDEAKHEFGQLRIDRGASFSSKVSLQSEMTAMQKQLQDNRRTIHNETILAGAVAESSADNDAKELDVEKADLAGMIAKDKRHSEYLEAKTYPGKENLLKRIEDQKQEIVKIKEEISHSKAEKEAKESKLKEHIRILHDHREEYNILFAKMEVQCAEAKETKVALERQMKETATKNNDYRLILRNAKLYKYALHMLQKTMDKEKKLAKMSNE